MKEETGDEGGEEDGEGDHTTETLRVGSDAASVSPRSPTTLHTMFIGATKSRLLTPDILECDVAFPSVSKSWLNSSKEFLFRLRLEIAIRLKTAVLKGQVGYGF